MKDFKFKNTKRVFTFSKGDYSSVYNEADYSNNDSTVSRLFEVTKFSNLKTLSNFEALRTKNANFIAELNNDAKFSEIEASMNHYAISCFSDKIINFISQSKEDEILKKINTNDWIYHSKIK